MKKSKLVVLSIISVLFLTTEVINAQFQANCQNKELAGSYILEKDSDGKIPKKGATITLILSGISAEGESAKAFPFQISPDILDRVSLAVCGNMGCNLSSYRSFFPISFFRVGFQIFPDLGPLKMIEKEGKKSVQEVEKNLTRVLKAKKYCQIWCSEI